MSFLSNLSGTYRNSLNVKKDGAKLVYMNKTFSFMNYNISDLIPVSVGTPVNDDDAITLKYLNDRNGNVEYNVTLSGQYDPVESIGSDGDVYYKINSTNILNIYIKDQNKWKPFIRDVDSDYVTYLDIDPNDWSTGSNGTYSYTLLSSVHGRGHNVIIQIQTSTGEIYVPEITVNSNGDITLVQIGAPTNIRILLIGDTTLSTTFNTSINQSDWTLVDSKYEYTVTATTHAQVGDGLFIAVYKNTVDSVNSTSPFEVTTVDTIIDGTFNVTLSSLINFSGKLVISGK